MPLKTKYIEEQEVDDDEFVSFKTQEELVATLKRLIVVINSDAATDKSIVQAVERNNAAIANFVQVIQNIKFEIPNLRIPEINQDIITQSIESSSQRIIDNQNKTNELLQKLIDSRVIEWEFKRIESNSLGGIQKVDAKAIKYLDNGG